ncbi:hypothetical protein QQF64_023199, partial [Cirrhinus molitorella]
WRVSPVTDVNKAALLRCALQIITFALWHGAPSCWKMHCSSPNYAPNNRKEASSENMTLPQSSAVHSPYFLQKINLKVNERTKFARATRDWKLMADTWLNV